MILPTIRASLCRNDAQQLVHLLGREDRELGEAAQLRLEESGIGSLLDDPRIQNALLTDPDVTVPPQIIFYVLVRQALLEGGIDDENTSDYVASMLFSFGQARRAYRISDGDDGEFHYLTDIIAELRSAGTAWAAGFSSSRAHGGLRTLDVGTVSGLSRGTDPPEGGAADQLLRGVGSDRLPWRIGESRSRRARGGHRPAECGESVQRGAHGAESDLRSALLAGIRRSGRPSSQRDIPVRVP